MIMSIQISTKPLLLNISDSTIYVQYCNALPDHARLHRLPNYLTISSDPTFDTSYTLDYALILQCTKC